MEGAPVKLRPQNVSESNTDETARARSMTGNEAMARGVWEAGVTVAAAYPGTPSTEILENLATYPVEDLHAQWSTNEKVASDVAIGASFAGVRAFAAMKHVGLNVAADSVMSLTYIGVNGGLVFVVCDDPGIHSSQNEQDTRLFCRMAMVPVLEPSDAQEALDMVRLGYEISERFDTPVIVRSTTRLSHTRSAVAVGERQDVKPRGFVEDPAKNVLIPVNARARHPRLLERETAFKDYLEETELSRWEKGRSDIGVVTVGLAYTYVKEVMPDASVLKLSGSYPLAEETLKAFCASVDRVLIAEELEPVIEDSARALGLDVEGKRYFPRVGEFSVDVVRGALQEAGLLGETGSAGLGFQVEPLARPPVLCPGCPHTTSFMALRALDARVAGDIGCYTLATIEPLKAIDTCVAMGCSIGNAVGISKAGGETKPIVATIGDSTFLHSGIPALIDAVYNQANITVALLDNHTVAMTGGQDHPGTGRTLRGETTHRVDFPELVRSLGVPWVRTVDSYDVGAVSQAFREAVAYKGVSVVISDRPCVLDPIKIKGPPFTVIDKDCVACQTCMNLGCPSITWSDELHDGHHKVRIDQETCIGCTLCAQVCPTGCIQANAG